MYKSEVYGKGGIYAKVVEDSIANGTRITTLELCYPRFVHSEFMTHRQFCLDGDSELEFDLPAGMKGAKYKRVFTMSLKEFADKWENGNAEHFSRGKFTTLVYKINPACSYTAKEAASILGYKSASNIRTACRKGEIITLNPSKRTGEDHIISGKEIIRWIEQPVVIRKSVRSRLKNMRIRQLNESTGKIEYSNVVDCIYSGKKEVFEITAGDFSVAGSKDHRILTSDGWKKIEELIIGEDFIITKKFGKTEEDKLDPLEYNKIDDKWKSTFNRDVKSKKLLEQENMCFDCGTDISDYSECHHIVPVHVDATLAFNEENIVVLCHDCHRERHKVQSTYNKGDTYLYGFPVLLESIESLGEKDTYDLEIAGEFPNFLANGVVVHNSRNASSSRAIPVKKMIEQVEANPATPIHFGKNQAGMQAFEELNREKGTHWWLQASYDAVYNAEELMDLGYHKQIVNRLLEPFQFIKVVVTATEWENFFNLRDHKDAQPEIQELAKCMKEALGKSVPNKLLSWEWHLPYVDIEDFWSHPTKGQQEGTEYDWSTAIKCSAARCARTSYLKHDNATPSVEDDLELYNQLAVRPHVDKRGNSYSVNDPVHLSPLEHICAPMDLSTISTKWPKGITHVDKNGNYWSGNFKNWIQYRQLI